MCSYLFENFEDLFPMFNIGWSHVSGSPRCEGVGWREVDEVEECEAAVGHAEVLGWPHEAFDDRRADRVAHDHDWTQQATEQAQQATQHNKQPCK